VTRLLYIANNRIPTEKAHGLQIIQMCEAFTHAGYEVTLVTARRINTPEMQAIPDLWAHYGVQKSFDFKRLPCLDLLNTVPARFQQIAFLLQTFSYLLVLWIWLLFHRFEVYYTRDLFVGLWIKLTHPRASIAYEIHSLHHTNLGRRWQRWLIRHSHVITVTGHLAERAKSLGAERVLVEHDGFRLGRFEHLPTRDEARAQINLPTQAFIVGYVGQLHTLNMSKGLDTLVDAVKVAMESGANIDLLVVGGPESGVQALRDQWQAHHLPPNCLHTLGQVPPDEVPAYLRAMDVGVMPLPWTEHFAYYASALKLFEYMAAGCAVLASDLPSTAEVARHGESALLVPASDVAAFAGAIRQLYMDGALCQRLSQQAQLDARHYTWEARATRIRAFIEEQG
jgi:glycosyltransferase involved in cell wall biosynthesis